MRLRSAPSLVPCGTLHLTVLQERRCPARWATGLNSPAAADELQLLGQQDAIEMPDAPCVVACVREGADPLGGGDRAEVYP